jgi:hypothetical protein
MNERLANIDLAFRNGLRDYEVLPPPEVWNNIETGLGRKRRPVYIMRAAAFLAIAMTLSVLAYRWIGKSVNTFENSMAVIDEESSAPSSGKFMNALPSSSPEIKRSADLSEAGLAQNIENEVVAAPVSHDQTVIERLPGANIRMPQGVTSTDIVRQRREIGKDLNTTLTYSSTSVSYQDYLSSVPVSDPKSSKTNKWSIAALASPTYYGKITTGSGELSKQIMSSEQAVLSYSGGVALAYNLNKRLSIQSGLFYSSVGQELDGINSFAGFQQYDNNKGDHNFEILTSNGTVTTSNADVFLMADGSGDRIVTSFTKDVFDPQKASLDYINNTMRQSFSYLELPVFLRYKLVDKTLGLNLIGGLSYNLLVNNSVYTVIDGNKYMIGTTEGLNMFSVSSSFGMGMEYKFSGNLSLNLEPTFRYYLNTFNTVGGSQFHPYSFGIFSGVSYKF